MTTIITAAGTGLVGFGLAIPAIASADSAPTSTTKTTAPLTSSQQDSILDYLADHPQLAQGLATRAQGWAALLKAHPEIQTELTKVLALPQDQRKAELQKWLAANPTAKSALQDYRHGLKADRLTKQRDRLDQRIKHLQS